MIQKNWQDLIKPTKLDVQAGEDPRRIATVVAEPLERGFGVTLGNSLRRILLSSLQGAAITAVQIDGVLHEFSSIPGVREDVTDIILNIKGLVVSSDNDEPVVMYLRKQGPGAVTAADIAPPAGVEVTILVRRGVTWYAPGVDTPSDGRPLQVTDTQAARFLRGEI